MDEGKGGGSCRIWPSLYIVFWSERSTYGESGYILCVSTAPLRLHLAWLDTAPCVLSRLGVASVAGKSKRKFRTKAFAPDQECLAYSSWLKAKAEAIVQRVSRRFIESSSYTKIKSEGLS